LDPDFKNIPTEFKQPTIKETIRAFNREVIEATHDLVCAYKPNFAFYIEHGSEEIEALKLTIEDVRSRDKQIPIILDAKWADVGNTCRAYVRTAFDFLGVDAVTVNPYLGEEAIQPFLNINNKGIIILCRTSNPGAKDIQNEIVSHPQLGKVPLYQKIAYQAAHDWNKNGNISLVVGATCPEELVYVRKIVGDEMNILIPGLGHQGGKYKNLIGGLNSKKRGIIASNSREIIFAKPLKGENFQQAMRRKALNCRDSINVYR
jgi:orotidine-5'-phosphate decarboxylase